MLYMCCLHGCTRSERLSPLTLAEVCCSAVLDVHTESNKDAFASVLISLVLLVNPAPNHSQPLAVLVQQWNSRTKAFQVAQSHLKCKCSSVVVVRREGGRVYLPFRPCFLSSLYLSVTDTGRYRVLSRILADHQRIYDHRVWIKIRLPSIALTLRFSKGAFLNSLSKQK